MRGVGKAWGVSNRDKGHGGKDDKVSGFQPVRKGFTAIPSQIGDYTELPVSSYGIKAEYHQGAWVAQRLNSSNALNQDKLSAPFPFLKVSELEKGCPSVQSSKSIRTWKESRQYTKIFNEKYRLLKPVHRGSITSLSQNNEGDLGSTLPHGEFETLVLLDLHHVW